MSKKSMPVPILFPLYEGNPCVYWPKGVREGSCKPAVMLRRDNDHMLDVLELRNGESVEYQHLRHVDDPFFIQNPAARAHTGAWDYARGVAYNFLVPGRIQYWEAVKGMTPEVGQVVLHLANEGLSPVDIARTIATNGISAERVNDLIQVQTNPTAVQAEKAA